MKRLLLCFAFLTGLCCERIVASEYFTLPYPIGKTCGVSQGNWDDSLGANNITHVNIPGHTTMMYAYDFLLAWGDSIVASAPGTVIHVINGYNSGFGNLVVVAYSDGTYGKFCHMADQIKNGVNYLTRVAEGQKISRGQLIGFCGATGHVTGPHLHYQRQSSSNVSGQAAQSVKTSFVEVQENGGRPMQGHKYTSFSYFSSNMFSVGAFIDGWKTACLGTFSPSSDPFAICYNYYGGTNVLGALQSEVHLYPRDFSAMNLPWCQDFLYIAPNGTQNDYAMILNQYQTNSDMGFQGVCYIVGGKIRSYWLSNYNHLGPPASQEYYWQGAGPDGKVAQYSVQYFQTSSLSWIGVMYANGVFQEVNQGYSCYKPANIFSGTGQIFCQANCPNGGGDDYYGIEEDTAKNTTQDSEPVTSPSSCMSLDNDWVLADSTHYTYGGLQLWGTVYCTAVGSCPADTSHKYPLGTRKKYNDTLCVGDTIHFIAKIKDTASKFRLILNDEGAEDLKDTSGWYIGGGSGFYYPTIAKRMNRWTDHLINVYVQSPGQTQQNINGALFWCKDIPDTSNHSSTPTASYPFEYGFTPVQKTVGEYDGMVICLDTASAADTGAESYHKISVDSGSIFQYGNDVYYFGMYRKMKGKFRLASVITRNSAAYWDNLQTAFWDSTGLYAWDYCPHITRETKPSAGSYQVSYYLDAGSGYELMQTRNYKVVASTAANNLSLKKIKSDRVFCQGGKIIFDLGSAKNVSLQIYNLAGREIKSINGFYSSGQYQHNLPRGLYFVKFNGLVNRLIVM